MIISLLFACLGFAGAGAEEPENAAVPRQERIEAAFNGLNKDTMDALGDFYAEDVVFEDPLGKIEGLPDLRGYYENMYANVKDIRFDFSESVVEGDAHVVFWTMTMSVSRLNGGKPISVDGNSLIRFDEDDKVVYHRDTFDMGAMVYEQVPLLRHPVRWIKKRLAHDS